MDIIKQQNEMNSLEMELDFPNKMKSSLRKINNPDIFTFYWRKKNPEKIPFFKDFLQGFYEIIKTVKIYIRYWFTIKVVVSHASHMLTKKK